MLHPGVTEIWIDGLSFASKKWFGSSSAQTKNEVEKLFYDRLLELPNVLKLVVSTYLLNIFRGDYIELTCK